MGNMKVQIEELRKSMQEGFKGQLGDAPKSYFEAIREKKKESVIIIKPKEPQESEETKNVVKEKIDIKSLPIGVSKLRKGGKGSGLFWDVIVKKK